MHLLWERTLAFGTKQSAPLFFIIQLQRLEYSVASRLPPRQSAPLCQELHPPLILNEPLPLFFITFFLVQILLRLLMHFEVSCVLLSLIRNELYLILSYLGLILFLHCRSCVMLQLIQMHSL